MPNTSNYREQGGASTVVGGVMTVSGEIKVATGGKITNAGTQANHIADLTITTDLTGVDTGTYMTAAQAGQIGTDLAAIATKLNAVIAVLEGIGATKTS